MRNFILFFLLGGLMACTNSKKQEATKSENKVEPEKSEPTKDFSKDITEEMAYFEGGTFVMGSNNRLPQEAPAHKVVVEPFYIDKTPVTVAEFRKFIDATNFVTEAERFGDAAVYNFDLMQWELKKGTTWHHPMGPDKPEAKDNHPVTQVSWNDAVAYAKWADKRLPTEIEWEYAAKGGKTNDNLYSWGNQLIIDGEYKANYWQGEMTDEQGKDGFKLTSPVGHYGKTKEGLSDLSGNVWEWCADVYKMYEGNPQPYRVSPKVKTIRGGSFFFDSFGDESLTVTFRSKNSSETSLFNTGFRCAK